MAGKNFDLRNRDQIQFVLKTVDASKKRNGAASLVGTGKVRAEESVQRQRPLSDKFICYSTGRLG